MRPLLNLILVLVSVAYPLLVYLGIQHVSPALFALVLASLALAKFMVARRAGRKPETAELALLIVALGYSLALVITNSELMLRFYPVLISLCVALLFALSLRAPESLIERLARLAGETITPRARSYTRKLTLIWALLLFGNALVALYLAIFASLKSWALYNGLVSYVFFAVFFALEYTYRRYYIHKYREPA